MVSRLPAYCLLMIPAGQSHPARIAGPSPVIAPSLAVRPSHGGHRGHLSDPAWVRSGARRPPGIPGMRRAGSLSRAWPSSAGLVGPSGPAPTRLRPQMSLGGSTSLLRERWVASLPHVLSGGERKRRKGSLGWRLGRGPPWRCRVRGRSAPAKKPLHGRALPPRAAGPAHRGRRTCGHRLITSKSMDYYIIAKKPGFLLDPIDRIMVYW